MVKEFWSAFGEVMGKTRVALFCGGRLHSFLPHVVSFLLYLSVWCVFCCVYMSVSVCYVATMKWNDAALLLLCLLTTDTCWYYFC